MQPNQQDPNTLPEVPQQPAPVSSATPTQPLPYQVPEYLGLEPASPPPQPRQSHKLRWTIIGASVILLAVLVSMVAIYFINRSDPESRFYDAIGKLLETSYINRDGSLIQAGVASASYKAQSDFSTKSTPRSAIVYSYSPSGENVNGRKIKGDIVQADSSSYYARITTFPAVLSAQNLTANQWYEVSLVANSSNASFVDNLNLHSLVNSSFGDFIIANLNVDERSQMTDLMKAKKMYSIDKVYEDEVGGVSASAFVVSVSPPAVQEVNKELARIIGVKLPYPYDTHVSGNSPKMTYIVWISDKDSRIIKTSEKHKSGDGQVETEVLYSYPSSVGINKPRADTIKQLAPRR